MSSAVLAVLNAAEASSFLTSMYLLSASRSSESAVRRDRNFHNVADDAVEALVLCCCGHATKNNRGAEVEQWKLRLVRWPPFVTRTNKVVSERIAELRRLEARAQLLERRCLNLQSLAD